MVRACMHVLLYPLHTHTHTYTHNRRTPGHTGTMIQHTSICYSLIGLCDWQGLIAQQQREGVVAGFVIRVCIPGLPGLKIALVRTETWLPVFTT